MVIKLDAAIEIAGYIDGFEYTEKVPEETLFDIREVRVDLAHFLLHFIATGRAVYPRWPGDRLPLHPPREERFGIPSLPRYSRTRNRDVEEDRCPKCGGPLKGNPGCPECFWVPEGGDDGSP